VTRGVATAPAAIALAAFCAMAGARCSFAAEAAGGAPARVTAVVLGVAQDGGVPHLGCSRACCRAARRDPRRAHRVASIGIVHEAGGSPAHLYLIDATPDMRSQIDSLAGAAGAVDRPAGLPVDGVFLTHAHIGHYTGLMFFGKESMAAREVPVHATERMIGFLSGNAPWSRLIERGQISARPFRPGEEVRPAPGLSITPLRVAHREEDSDVVGFLVAGPSRRLLYVPDIDAWERWDQDIAALVREVDVAILDGTFFSAGELPGRSLAEIPHPLMGDTMDRLAAVAGPSHRVLFAHLNHSNPALRRGSAERRTVRARGFEVAADGMRFPL
jgi:pyrroloquinoline quinone biosynthesis protein B